MSDHSELTRDAVVTLYTRLLEGWNERDAGAFAFDGRPQLGERLTAELTTVHRAGRIVDAS